VKTFLGVVTSHLYTQSQSQPKERFIGQYNALEALAEFMQTGNLTQRRMLLEDMKKHHVINICLSVRIYSTIFLEGKSVFGGVLMRFFL
jgi:hypothetical protein